MQKSRIQCQPKKKIRRAGHLYLVIAMGVIALFVLGWLVLQQRQLPVVDAPGAVAGEVDLSGADTQACVIRLPDNWEFYPERLYTHEDFAEKRPEAPQLYREVAPASMISYGTYRLVLHLQPQQYYSIFGFSVNYGTWVYVNGQLVMQVGIVSDHADTAVPSANQMRFPLFSGADGRVELLLQYSNFVQCNGGGLNELLLSTPANITEYAEITNLPTNLISCGLLVLFLYYILHAVVRKNRIALCIACCCAVFALRDQNLYIVQLLPWDYAWAPHYRITNLIMGLIPLLIVTITRELYPYLVHRWVNRIYNVLFGALVLLLFLLPTQSTATVRLGFYALSALYGGWMLICGTRHVVKGRRFAFLDILFTIAIAQLWLVSMVEAGLIGSIPQITMRGLTPLSSLVFILIMMGIEAQQGVKQEQALAESRYRNAMLLRLNELKEDFLREMAHELKTPLAVISGYAQLTGWQIAGSSVNAETSENLQTICQETARLSNLVTRLLSKAENRQEEILFSEVSVPELFAQAQAVLQPMLARKNNTLEAACHDCEKLWANRDMLLQVLLNLAMNANRHMENGTVRFMAERDDEISLLICIRVQDTGSGIAPKDRPRVFETGFSTDGSKGLGLPICRELVELHGGSILIEETDQTGTTVRFTIWEREEGFDR